MLVVFTIELLAGRSLPLIAILRTFLAVVGLFVSQSLSEILEAEQTVGLVVSQHFDLLLDLCLASFLTDVQ